MYPEKSAPTLDDVARLANVSTATVSRCLNSPDRVVESTRSRVMEAVQTLGYTPNFGARVMAAKRTFTIGAIIPTMDNSIFALGLQAFQEGLNDRGYTLLVASSMYRTNVEEEQIRALVARGADGLLLIGHERDPAIYDYLRQQQVPVLIAWSYLEGSNPPSVGFDNRLAMAEMATKIIELGHKKIAMISGVLSGNDRAQLRLHGVRDAVEKAGLDPNDLNVIEAPYEIEKGASAMSDLMALPARPTAVICANDVLAAGATRAAKEMGLRVPEDVSITGFDDMELARIVDPPLTTVKAPLREMGSEAAREIIQMVEGRGSGRSVCLMTELILRGSLIEQR